MQQTRLELVGAIPTGPDPRRCHVCEEMTERRCLVCRAPVCRAHSFVEDGNEFCWPHLLEVMFGASEINANG